MVSGHSRLRRSLAAFSLGAFAFLGAAPRASAAGVRAAGSAATSEWKTGGTASKARTRAIRRARVAALQAALAGLEGTVDDDAKRVALKAGERWTGAYRIVSEHVDAEGVRVELDVDIEKMIRDQKAQMKLADEITIKDLLRQKLQREMQGFRVSDTEYEELKQVNPDDIKNIVAKINNKLA